MCSELSELSEHICIMYMIIGQVGVQCVVQVEVCSEEIVQLDDTSACTLFCSSVKGRKKCTAPS